MKTPLVVLLIPMLLGPFTLSLHAQAPLHDPICREYSQRRFNSFRTIGFGSISCAKARRIMAVGASEISDENSNGHSCKGRREVIRTHPQPVCYPEQVTSKMIDDWRLRHP